MQNRSVPVDSVLPHLVYPDVAAALEWLGRVFGFVEHYHYGEPAQGAQVLLGKACVMLRTSRPGEASPAEIRCLTQSLTVFVDDVRAHYERAKAAGATVIEELNETMYGELQYGVRDFAGHHWLFSEHARDVDPASWGASVASTIR
jgi:uncharacterized glyoxalase superfamily protein PhnB